MSRILLGAVVLLVVACTVYGVRVEELPPHTPVAVRSPVKAHLVDGSTIVFRRGVAVTDERLEGAGVRYGLTLAESTLVDLVPLDSVVGMEVFRDDVDWAPTIALTTLTMAGVAAAAAVAAVAIFGSCPTVYADSSGTAVLQAEAFSYSIARVFEMRDVDGVRVQPGADGTVRLEIRNEALETHYLNHLELLLVDHDPGEVVAPDPHGQPLAIGRLAPPVGAVDAAGRDLRDVLTNADGVVFATDPGTLSGATADDLRDFIEVELTPPEAADSVALVLRVRNSLLATVLLYDVMLGGRGPHALDYVGEDLEELGHAMELGRFARQQLGLQVAVWDGTEFRQVGRIGDTGPIAWKDVAILVPVLADGPVRVRLTFAVDNWRVDRVAAGAWRRPTVRTVPLAAVTTAERGDDDAAWRSLTAPDERYLKTVPSQRFFADFEVGPAPPHRERTFLLAWQGYYTEWIRPAWMLRGRDSLPPPTGSQALSVAVARWRTVQDSLERLFYATRIPVR